MAVVQFGPIVSDARKKVGGVVFTKSRFGSIVRKKVSPVQPRTSAQLDVRASLTDFSKSWSGALTAAERAAWNAFTKNNPVKDVFGNTVSLTGLQMYVRLNQALTTVGGTPITNPPSSLVVGYPGSLTVAISHTGPAYSITPTNAPGANDAPVIESTGVVSAGKTFLTTKYRIIAIEAAAATPPFLVPTEYVTKFGSIVANSTIATRLSYTNFLTGAQSLGTTSIDVAA